MARHGSHDPADEHDINELRKYVHQGSTPQFAGKPKSGLCSVVLLVLLVGAAAVVWGSYELVSSLAAAAVPRLSGVDTRPHGRHARSGVGAAVDWVRWWLLEVLPEQPPLDSSVTRVMPERVRREEWHAVATGFGDLLELVVGVLAVVVVTALGAGAAIAVALLVPWWVSVGVAGTGVAGWVVWRLRVAGRQLGRLVDEEAPR